MRFLALALAFDGALSSGGPPSPRTLSTLERLKACGRRALLVTRAEGGEGVVELIEELLGDDLRQRRATLRHDALRLGTDDAGEAVCLPAYGHNLLVVGPSGSGRTRVAHRLLDSLTHKGYQACVIDPVGDFARGEGLVRLGSRRRAPETSEVLGVLADPAVKVTVDLSALAASEREGRFAELLTRLLEMRGRTGRPHWLLVNGAHLLWPAGGGTSASQSSRLGETVLLTEAPSRLPRAILRLADTVVATGPSPGEGVQRVAELLGEAPPAVPFRTGGPDEVVAWLRSEGHWPMRMRVLPTRSERQAHRRRLVSGDLGPDSFVFRGPEGTLQLRAPNVETFCKLVQDVDAHTWQLHLWQGDVSRWMRDALQDDVLARRVQTLERQYGLTACESRRRVCDAIAQRYALASWRVESPRGGTTLVSGRRPPSGRAPW